ncbi:LIM and SH3 domain protein Lasp isoform X1 [Cherax quadricarinatus]|nr:LIM and SH3 domain protein F42H10.3-like isoform X1 [Cherax quadricarinatus]
MSKKCARCEKAVYPLEELKCLDKIWHKGCFKCQECAMTLSMKTYKGYNKLPYCEAHIPKAKATTVAETPEMRRLAENTKIQSNVQYHADFEKNKAKFTQVADDPETQRLKKNTQIISNVIYHGELAKKSEMERKRTEPNDDDDDDDDAGRSSGLDTFGGDIATATASVHHTIASHLQTDNSNTYSYSHEIPAPPHSRQPQDYSAHTRSHVQSKPYNQQQSATPHHSGKQSRSNNNNPSAYIHNENFNPAPGYIPPSNSQAPNTIPLYSSEYDDDNRYYPYSKSMGGQNASDNHYTGKATNGSSGSYPSTNRHSASYSNYPTNNHYATGAPPRDDSKRQQEHQQQMQQQQQHHQQLQKHHQQLQQQQQSYAASHQQQYSGPPPSSQHRHPPQTSSTSFLHHQHQQQFQQPQQKQQHPPTSSYHHHPAPQNMFHDANHNSPYSARTSQTLIYSSQTGPVQQQPTRRVGSIADYDPVNEQYGSISQGNANPAGGGYRQETTYQVQRTNLYGDQQSSPAQMNSNPSAHHKVTAPPTQLGRCYRAMYDYEAADTDEVSFRDGDLIINCTAIDEGWMTGTIQRTGVTGMLPANYVERVS